MAASGEHTPAPRNQPEQRQEQRRQQKRRLSGDEGSGAGASMRSSSYNGEQQHGTSVEDGANYSSALGGRVAGDDRDIYRDGGQGNNRRMELADDSLVRRQRRRVNSPDDLESATPAAAAPAAPAASAVVTTCGRSDKQSQDHHHHQQLQRVGQELPEGEPASCASGDGSAFSPSVSCSPPGVFVHHHYPQQQQPRDSPHSLQGKGSSVERPRRRDTITMHQPHRLPIGGIHPREDQQMRRPVGSSSHERVGDDRYNSYYPRTPDENQEGPVVSPHDQVRLAKTVSSMPWGANPGCGMTAPSRNGAVAPASERYVSGAGMESFEDQPKLLERSAGGGAEAAGAAAEAAAASQQQRFYHYIHNYGQHPYRPFWPQIQGIPARLMERAAAAGAVGRCEAHPAMYANLKWCGTTTSGVETGSCGPVYRSSTVYSSSSGSNDSRVSTAISPSTGAVNDARGGGYPAVRPPRFSRGGGSGEAGGGPNRGCVGGGAANDGQGGHAGAGMVTTNEAVFAAGAAADSQKQRKSASWMEAALISRQLPDIKSRKAASFSSSPFQVRRGNGGVGDGDGDRDGGAERGKEDGDVSPAGHRGHGTPLRAPPSSSAWYRTVPRPSPMPVGSRWAYMTAGSTSNGGGNNRSGAGGRSVSGDVNCRGGSQWGYSKACDPPSRSYLSPVAGGVRASWQGPPMVYAGDDPIRGTVGGPGYTEHVRDYERWTSGDESRRRRAHSLRSADTGNRKDEDRPNSTCPAGWPHGTMSAATVRGVGRETRGDEKNVDRSDFALNDEGKRLMTYHRGSGTLEPLDPLVRAVEVKRP